MRFIARNNKRRRRVRGGVQRPDSIVVQPPLDTNPLWSDPATWGGSVPTTNDAVEIPANTIIVLDVSSAALGRLDIYGTLKFKNATNLTLSASAIWIHAGGKLQIGSADSPFTAQALIELTGAFVPLSSSPSNVAGASAGTNDSVSRGINVEGSIIMVGSPLAYTHTLLAASCSASATSFSLVDSPGWLSGDQIVIGPSDYYDTVSGASEALTLSGASSGTSISTTSGISAARWGVLQYPTDTGVSLTPGTFTPPDQPFPNVLDERAPVINTTRNIKIQGKNDTHWSTNGHGVHIMLMGSAAYAYLDSVEIKRCGQRAALGRYPIHWHMISYNEATGAFISDNTSILKNSAIWDSSNRAITIHGTNGVTVQNNVCYNIIGHAIFQEDGPERRNTIDRNVVLKVRQPTSGLQIKKHDREDSFSGPSGFWIANHDNTITNNRAADCQGAGFWSAMAERCFGNSSLVPLKPIYTPMLVFSGNIGHSNNKFGHLIDLPPIDDLGTIQVDKYEPTTTGNSPPSVSFTNGIDVRINFFQSRFWKNNSGGYKNRVGHPLYREWVLADNGDMDLQGQTSETGDTTLAGGHRNLHIGTSLNTGVYPSLFPRAALATYHGTIHFSDCVFIGYPWVDGYLSSPGQTESGGGVFRLNDFYIQGLEKSISYSRNNVLINSNGGFKTRSPNIDGNALNDRNWALAGAIYDGSGIFTTAGRYWIDDVPFLTDGLVDLVDVDPAGSNGKATATTFYAISSYYTNFDTNSRAAVTVEKVDNSLNVVGTWAIGDGTLPNAIGLGNFRHAALQKGGRYIVTYPNSLLPTTFSRVILRNAALAVDNVIIALPWSGSVTPKVSIWAVRGSTTSYPTAGNFSSGVAKALNSAASRAEVEAGAGTLYYFDSANNRVWVKFVGGQLTDPGWATELELDYKYQQITIGAA